MTPLQKVLVAVTTLPIAAATLAPLPAFAQFSIGGFGLGIGIGTGGWNNHGGGVFFGISPTIVIPPSQPASKLPPPPECKTPPPQPGVSQPEAEPKAETVPQPVFVTGHWEYLADGRQRWIPDHYECR